MKRVYLAATLAAAIALPAQAQETRKFDGPWIGATVGYDRMASRSDANAKSGVTYGGAAGYDFRLGKLVAGIEFERSGNSIEASTHDVEVVGDLLDLSVGRDRYIGVRAGIPVSDQVLLYAKGGYTKLHSHSRYVAGDEVTKDTSDRGGWRIGAGAELSLGKPFMRLEYRFSDYKKFEEEIIKSHRHQIMFVAGMHF